jgi:hypothetical protein
MYFLDWGIIWERDSWGLGSERVGADDLTCWRGGAAIDADRDCRAGRRGNRARLKLEG